MLVKWAHGIKHPIYNESNEVIWVISAWNWREVGNPEVIYKFYRQVLGPLKTVSSEVEYLSALIENLVLVIIWRQNSCRHLSALLQLHRHSRLNNVTWLKRIGQKQRQDETRNISVVGFGASYIRGLTLWPCSSEAYLSQPGLHEASNDQAVVWVIKLPPEWHHCNTLPFVKWATRSTQSIKCIHTINVKSTG